jgi:hypothetical protein
MPIYQNLSVFLSVHPISEAPHEAPHEPHQVVRPKHGQLHISCSKRTQLVRVFVRPSEADTSPTAVSEGADKLPDPRRASCPCPSGMIEEKNPHPILIERTLQ